jgi:hypothetical protein
MTTQIGKNLPRIANPIVVRILTPADLDHLSSNRHVEGYGLQPVQKNYPRSTGL